MRWIYIVGLLLVCQNAVGQDNKACLDSLINILSSKDYKKIVGYLKFKDEEVDNAYKRVGGVKELPVCAVDLDEIIFDRQIVNKYREVYTSLKTYFPSSDGKRRIEEYYLCIIYFENEVVYCRLYSYQRDLYYSVREKIIQNVLIYSRRLCKTYF